MKRKMFNKNYILTVAAAVLFYTASFMLNSVSGQYSTQLGADKTMAGIVTAAFTVSSFLARPFRGLYTDKKGRKQVLSAGGLLCLAAAAVLVFTESIFFLIAARVLFGCGYSGFTTAGGTMVCDVSDKDSLADAISFYGVTNVLSQAVAPGLALWLYGKSFRILAVVECGVLIAVIITGRLIKYDEIRFINRNKKFELYEKSALPSACVIFFFACAIASVYAFVPMMTEERGISGTGWFFAVSAAGLLVSRLFNSAFCRKYGKNTVFYAGAALFATGFAVLIFAPNLLLLLVAAALYGTGAGFVHPVLNTSAVSGCTAEKRGLATGTFMMSQDLGMTAGALAWGYIGEKAGFRPAYAAVTFAAAVMAVVYFILLHKENKR